MKLKSIFLALLFFHSIALFAQQIEWKDILGTFEFSLEHGSYIEITFNKDSTFLKKSVAYFSGISVTDIYTGSFSFKNNWVHLQPKKYIELDTEYGNDTIIWQESIDDIPQFSIIKDYFVSAYQYNFYLLSKDTMINDFSFFINSINAQNDWKIEGFTKPTNSYTSIHNIILPEIWKKRIKITPLEAKIIEITEWQSSKPRFVNIYDKIGNKAYKINKGTKDNVFIGMDLWHSDDSCNLQIVEVHENYSIGILHLANNCSCEKGFILSSKYLGED